MTYHTLVLEKIESQEDFHQLQFVSSIESLRIFSKELSNVELALTTGLRRGELLALEWKNVDLDQCTIDVVQSLSYSQGKTIIKEPKTNNSKRKVSIPDLLLPELKVYYLFTEEYRKNLGWSWGAGEKLFVFFSEFGKHFFHTALGKWFSRFTERTGIRRIRFHDLRHTSATLLIDV
jgi:integrase